MNRFAKASFLLTPLFAATAAWPQAVIDGNRDALYGAPAAVQTVDTGFGDNDSELDAAYGSCEGGRLSLFLAGNVEANFNRLEIFIDSRAGGQGVYDAAGNDNTGAMDGLVFDAGFTADYQVIFRRGTDLGNQRVDVDFADLAGQSASGYFDVMSGSGLDGIGSTGTGVNASALFVAYDGSNAAGVGGGSGAANQAAAAAVVTGLELSIALADLGYDGSQPLRVMVGQNNVGHDYWSNQFLGGVAAPQGNLGGDGTGGFTGEGAIDFTTIAGNQSFEACGAVAVVEVPTLGHAGAALLAALLAGAAIFAVRRR